MVRATSRQSISSLLGLALLLAGCSSGRAEKEEECERLTDDIRKTATARGKNPTGICNDPDSPEFAESCAAARRCHAELEDM